MTAQCCLLPIYFPGFCVKTPCSFSFISAKLIPREELIVFLSDLGCFIDDFEECQSFENVWICENHIKELRGRAYNRQRTSSCMLPTNLKSHNAPRTDFHAKLFHFISDSIKSSTGCLSIIRSMLSYTNSIKHINNLPNNTSKIFL